MKFSIHYDERMIQESARVFLWRNHFRKSLPMIIALTVMALLLAVLGLYQAAGIAALLLVVLVGILAKANHAWRKQRRELFGMLGDGKVDYEISADGFKAVSKLVGNDVKWELFTGLQEERGWLFLLLPHGGFVSLPIPLVDPGIIAAIKEQVRPVAR
jgi:hypothetical protein